MNCRPGDLAVVISAKNKSNIGKIVRVGVLYDGKFVLEGSGSGPVWWIYATTRITWSNSKRKWRRVRGPAFDSQLRPIRPAKPKSQAVKGKRLDTVAG
ncbi:hypothetical protein GCM10027034_19850 [Ramlibacter solisilvae]|uniref:Uncharacterized protein n=1 Tax=Ramlibacter tataouinensis TaxID=94132 RepID=A0A127JV85_9BURK|nr:hypothetical protein [Ramlibacter tataouinensis]AMO23928.1 hypothetical protein UC35_14985 [Ramlibacter tataouinensis]